MELKDLTIKKASELLRAGEVSAVELAKESLRAIKEKNGELNAFLRVFEKESLASARAADELIKGGGAGALTGIPLAIKDNILIKGTVATAGSKILENYISSYDATVIKKLKEAGAVFVGKTNLDEFAMGASTENSAYGATKNPHDTSRVPGGSSGGSAAAVAADMCLGALGSDTGGSIRQPAGFCGVVGLKPSYGAVSRHGLMALASSLDQIGPITKTVEDAEIIFNIISGQDALDATSVSSREKSLESLTIGVPKEYFQMQGLDEEVKKNVENALAWYEETGAKIKEITLPTSKYAVPTYYIIVPAEASSNLGRYDGVRYGYSKRKDDLIESYEASRGEGFGEEPLRRIMTGTYVLSAGYFDAYYKKAKAVQQKIKQEFEEAFKSVDIIITPTSPTVAFKLGERTQDPLAMYASDIFTSPLNIAGLAGISIPCGRAQGMPVGMQIIAPWGREDLLFKVGASYENNHN